MSDKYTNLSDNEIFIGDFEFPVPLKYALNLIRKNIGINVRAENSINEKKQLTSPLNGICGIYGSYAIFADKRELQEQNMTSEKLGQVISNEDYITCSSELYAHCETFKK